jgi:hypothetical protein
MQSFLIFLDDGIGTVSSMKYPSNLQITFAHMFSKEIENFPFFVETSTFLHIGYCRVRRDISVWPTVHPYCRTLQKVSIGGWNCAKNFFWQTTSRCAVTYLYNALYTVNTQHYISRVILYIKSGYIMATRFDRKRSSSGQYGIFLRYNKLSTQWDPTSFTVKF